MDWIAGELGKEYVHYKDVDSLVKTFKEGLNTLKELFDEVDKFYEDFYSAFYPADRVLDKINQLEQEINLEGVIKKLKQLSKYEHRALIDKILSLFNLYFVEIRQIAHELYFKTGDSPIAKALQRHMKMRNTMLEKIKLLDDFVSKYEKILKDRAYEVKELLVKKKNEKVEIKPEDWLVDISDLAEDTIHYAKELANLMVYTLGIVRELIQGFKPLTNNEVKELLKREGPIGYYDYVLMKEIYNLPNDSYLFKVISSKLVRRLLDEIQSSFYRVGVSSIEDLQVKIQKLNLITFIDLPSYIESKVRKNILNDVAIKELNDALKEVNSYLKRILQTAQDTGFITLIHELEKQAKDIYETLYKTKFDVMGTSLAEKVLDRGPIARFVDRFEKVVWSLEKIESLDVSLTRLQQLRGNARELRLNSSSADDYIPLCRMARVIAFDAQWRVKDFIKHIQEFAKEKEVFTGHLDAINKLIEKKREDIFDSIAYSHRYRHDYETLQDVIRKLTVMGETLNKLYDSDQMKKLEELGRIADKHYPERIYNFTDTLQKIITGSLEDKREMQPSL